MAAMFLRFTARWRPGRAKGEEGASLLLALIFLVVVSVVIIATVGWAGNDIRLTAKFQDAQQFQAAADNASEAAVQYVRFNFLQASLGASPPAPCWSAAPIASALTSNGHVIDTWCGTTWTHDSGTPQNSLVRTVTIYSCLSSVSASGCVANPLLQSVVQIGDADTTTGKSTCTPETSTSGSGSTTCGTWLTIESWIFDRSFPA
jgi:Tfp pilus assembly protein PilX